MIIFTLKMFKNLRKAVAGRQYPHQLAGAVALGLLCGLIPHGNLLAIVLVFFAVCCNINHAMAALVGIGVTLVATKLDPYSHIVGEYVLSHQAVQPWMARAWAMPFIPWTDLNNTVVMGSFLIGLSATVPVFLLTLPVFKFFKPKPQDPDATATKATAGRANSKPTAKTRVDAPKKTEESQPFFLPVAAELPPIPFESAETNAAASAKDDSSKHGVRLVHQPHTDSQPPRYASREATIAAQDSALAAIPFDETPDSVDPEVAGSSLSEEDRMVSVDTRIEIIHLSEVNSESQGDSPSTSDKTVQPMDEALNYLLRQLRNSQQRNAAG